MRVVVKPGGNDAPGFSTGADAEPAHAVTESARRTLGARSDQSLSIEVIERLSCAAASSVAGSIRAVFGQRQGLTRHPRPKTASAASLRRDRIIRRLFRRC